MAAYFPMKGWAANVSRRLASSSVSKSAPRCWADMKLFAVAASVVGRCDGIAGLDDVCQSVNVQHF
jgi:hypothetical protein